MTRRRMTKARRDDSKSLERNIVVEILGVLFCATAAFANPGGAGRRLAPARARVARCAGKLDVATARSAALATAEQLHAIGDDFGRVFFDAVLVGVLACL